MLHLILFQVGWFICVIFGDLSALAYSGAYLVLHLTLIISNNASRFIIEIIWLAVFVVSGVIVEALFFSVGILRDVTYPSGGENLILPPIWLICLWLLFGISMRTTLSFMLTKVVLGLLLIGIGIPFSYFMGASLSDSVSIKEPQLLSLLVITIVWMAFYASIIFFKKTYFEDVFDDR